MMYVNADRTVTTFAENIPYLLINFFTVKFLYSFNQFSVLRHKSVTFLFVCNQDDVVVRRPNLKTVVVDFDNVKILGTSSDVQQQSQFCNCYDS